MDSLSLILSYLIYLLFRFLTILTILAECVHTRHTTVGRCLLVSQVAQSLTRSVKLNVPAYKTLLMSYFLHNFLYATKKLNNIS